MKNEVNFSMPKVSEEREGHILAKAHYSELSLLIEAGIDTALVKKLEAVANKVDNLSHAIRNDAELFN